MNTEGRRENLKNRVKRFAGDESSKAINPALLTDAAKAAALAGTLILGTPDAVDAKPRTVSIEQLRTIQLSEVEIDILAQNVYHEARGESVQGQLAVAQVTLARLLSGKYGDTLAKVIFALNQFSWTNDPKILMSNIDERRMDDIKTLLSFALGSRSVGEIIDDLSVHTGLPDGVLFYKRSDWTADNPDPRKRLSPKVAAFFAALENVRTIGSHDFYREKRVH